MSQNLLNTSNNEYPPHTGEQAYEITPDEMALSAAAKGVIALGGEKMRESDPFAVFGSIGGETIIVDGGVSPGIPLPLPNHEGSTEKPRAAERVGEKKSDANNFFDRKEAVAEAILDVKINKTAIANILRDRPELLEGVRSGIIDLEERRADVQATLDAIAGLPEKLHFDTGMTIIVGENGLGKSTFLRAMQMAIEISDSYKLHGSKGDFESFRAKMLDPRDAEKNFASSYNDTMPSPLSFIIAEHIDVADVATKSVQTKFFDITALAGSYNTQDKTSYSPHGTYGGAVSMDLTHGVSNGQRVINEVFGDNGYFGSRKRRGRSGAEIVMIDEPEVGLSPKNHRKIKQMINKNMGEGSIVLCASNSEVMYFDPTVRRIDLEHPELGAHTPAEHPDVYDLSEYAER